MVMAGALGAAAAGPYFVHNPPEGIKGIIAQLNAPPAASASVEPARQQGGPVAKLVPPSADSPQGPGSHLYRSLAPLEGIPQYDLGQVLRFDVTKEWVYQHWARKTTGLADADLFGVRVPLVTGTSMPDLAGSLSYYFDNAGAAQRIRFHGRTADTSRIVAIAQQYFGMTWQQGLVSGEQLLQAKEGDKVLSELRTRPEAVLWSTSPHDSFVVDFEANRPGGGRYVQPPVFKVPLADVPPPQPQPPQPILPSRSVIADAGTQTAAAPAATTSAPAPPTTVPAKPAGATVKSGQRDWFRWPE